MPRRGGFTIDELGRRRLGERPRRGVAGHERDAGQARPAAVSAAARRLDGQLDAGDRAAGRRTRESEAADAAVEVPDGRGVEGGDPRRAPARRARPRRSVLVWKNPCGRSARSRPSSRIGSDACGVSTISRSPSRTAACDGWTLSETTRECGSADEQPRQVLADPRLVGGRPHHEPQHQLAVGRLGEEHVLELATAASLTSYGDRSAPRDEGRHDLQRGLRPGECRPQSRRSTPSCARSRMPSVGAAAVPADDHLGLVAEPRVRAGDRRQPGRARADERARVRLLVASWSAYAGSRAASTSGSGRRRSGGTPLRSAAQAAHPLLDLGRGAGERGRRGCGSRRR